MSNQKSPISSKMLHVINALFSKMSKHFSIVNISRVRTLYTYSTWSVSPGLVVGGEHPQVTAPDKLLVVHLEQRVGGGEELWVEYDLQSKANTKDTYIRTYVQSIIFFISVVRQILCHVRT